MSGVAGILRAAGRPVNLAVLVGMLVLGLVLQVWLLAAAVVVYAFLVAVSLGQDDASELERLIGDAAPASSRQLDDLPPELEARVRTALAEEEAVLDELTRFPLAEPGLSEQVRALADELCAIASRAGEVDRYLSSIDIEALRERIAARGSSADARAEQLAVVEGLVRRRAELDGELEHVEAALGAIHAQLVAAHAAEARPDTLAGEVNDLRTRMRVLSESLAEAYEHRAPDAPGRPL
jgi:chromosome segregation ATPase